MKHVLVVCLVVFISAFTCGKSYSQWTQNSGPYGGTVYSLATIDNYLFASGRSGVYRSSDNGLHWKQTVTDLPRPVYSSQLTTIGSKLFINIDGTVFRSYDLGENWSRIRDLGTSVGSLFVVGSQIFAKLGFEQLGINVFMSNDSSETWKDVTNTHQLPGIRFIKDSTISYTFENPTSSPITYLKASYDTCKRWYIVVGMGSDISTVAVDPDHSLYIGAQQGITRVSKEGTAYTPTFTSFTQGAYSILTFGDLVFASTNDAIYSSQDKGENWVRSDTGLSGHTFNNLTSKGSVLFVTSHSGIFSSVDSGKHWIERNEGYNSLNIYTLDANEKFIFAGTEAGIFRSDDEGNHWSKANNGLTAPEIGALGILGNTIFAGATTNRVFRSDDNGGQWQLLDIAKSYYSANSFAIINNAVFANLSFGDIYSSIDSGKKWTNISSAKTNTHNVQSMFSIKDKLFAFTDKTFLVTSSDLGETWTTLPQDSPYFPPPASLSTNDKYIYVGTTNGLYRSSSNDMKFMSFDNNVSFLDVRSIFLFDKTIIVGTAENSIYISRDEGATWKYSSPAMPFGCTIPSLKKFGNYLFAATDGNGIWKHPLNTLSAPSHATPSAMPMIAYPNPLTNSTTMNFTTDKPNLVRLSVYNVLGNEVAMLCNQMLEAGEHSYSWNGSNSPQGMYHAILKINNTIKETSLVIVR